jgi:hypothetical protein
MENTKLKKKLIFVDADEFNKKVLKVAMEHIKI